MLTLCIEEFLKHFEQSLLKYILRGEERAGGKVRVREEGAVV